ncbi:MAG: hypothetical protein V1685_02630 [Parcubacteria group bacterium]
MPIIVSDSGKEFERATPGLHQAVCSNVYGPFEETYEWKGKVISARKVVIMFEIDERIKEGEFANQRFTISGRFTASLHEKGKLRPFLESWKGKAFTNESLISFDLEKLIGVNCQLNLLERDKKDGGKTVVIGGIVPRAETQEKMTPELPRDYAPKWIKDILTAQQAPAEHSSPESFEDDIPF